MFRKTIFLISFFILLSPLNGFAALTKEPEFGGQFYPAEQKELSATIDNFLGNVTANQTDGEIMMLISPHAGYGYSGQTAAFGYNFIKNKSYKTVIILGTSHHQNFNGAAIFKRGSFITGLGVLKIDEEFTNRVLGKNPEVFEAERVFSNEHSVEVQLPFLQKVLPGFSGLDRGESADDYDWKIVPVVLGDCSLESCKKIAFLFKEAIGQRRDVLIVVSSDLYHGYDYEEADTVDGVTLDLIKRMDYSGLYYALRDGKAQACGGFAIVVALNIAKESGCQRLEIFNHTNSAQVTGKPVKGEWTVGYASCAVFRQEGEAMLSIQQKERLLAIARQAIKVYLETGKKLEVSESESALIQASGAFVTLNQHQELRGCIGNLIGSQPLYLTVRDMAIEAAVDDPRFPALSLDELKEVEIEISVLSPLKKVSSIDEIILGKHGVLVQKGNQSGVFLPQVAGETGWSKEEFLNNLCAHKAGLAADAWRDKSAQIYIFSAEVFSEK